MSAASSSTPLVDRVLTDPLGIPRGLDVALRRIERGAREERARLAPLAARPDAVEAVHAAARELDRFLEDESRSPLLRALRRPLAQIAAGAAGGRSLMRCWDGVRARAASAVELQVAIDGIRAAVARVRERFASELPRSTRDLLREARLDDADLAHLARAADADALHRRLRRVEQSLERLRGFVAASGDAELQWESWEEDASPAELRGLLQLRLRTRESLREERDRAATLRLLAARQVRALGAAGGWERPAHTSAQAVAQRLGETLLTGDAGAGSGEDLPLWSELVAAASDTLFAADRPEAWTAQLPDVPLPEPRDTGSTRFVVPIDETYALISPHHPSAVRVMDLRVAMGDVVECGVFLEHGDAETLPLARLDVDPLFEGLTDAPGWYATVTRARLEVIARLGEGWIARRVRRGAVRRTKGRAWDAERSGGGRLRVLGTLSSRTPADPWEVGAAAGAEREFCGLRTIQVAPPLADCATAWLRAGDGSAGADEAVVAEEAWFRAVARRLPHTVPASAGRARLVERGAEGPMYVPPLGFRPDELPPLDAWLRATAAQALLSAVARLWTRLTEAGFALGVYHLDALTFTVGWTRGIRAVITDAPFATRVGHPHRRPPDDARIPRFRGLGWDVLPRAVSDGMPADVASEAKAFALFALDALSIQPIPISGRVTPEAVGRIAADLLGNFTYQAAALRLASALLPGAETDGLVKLIRNLATLPG